MTENSGGMIIITEKRNHLQAFKDFAAENGIMIPEPGDNISSTSYLREKTAETGSLSWIRKELLDYIKTRGFPLMIISDIRLNSGLDHDSDHLKVLRTILLSYILISQIEAYSDITCNLFLLADSSDYSSFSSEVQEPQLLLSNIKTNDERVNELIWQMKTDTQRFNRSFNIYICNCDSSILRIKSELNTFLNMIKAKDKLRGKLKKTETPAQMTPENSSAEPADIVFRLGDSYYVNGEQLAMYKPGRELNEGEIYLLGNFTSYTRVVVIERLLKLIKSGPSQGYSFRKNPDIVIHIPDDSVIDITAPITLAQLMSKELADFRNLRIKTSVGKSKIMQQSKGYSMIQKNLVLYQG